MDQVPLVSDLIDAGERFLEEFSKTYPVAVAFWLKMRSSNQWYLHVASPMIEDGKMGVAYGEVLRIAQEMKDIYLDPFNVKLRMMNDAMVQFALDYRRTYPSRVASVFNIPSFGGVEVEGMYLYPAQTTAVAS